VAWVLDVSVLGDGPWLCRDVSAVGAATTPLILNLASLPPEKCYRCLRTRNESQLAVGRAGSPCPDCSWLSGNRPVRPWVPVRELVPGLMIRHISRAHAQLEVAVNSDHLAPASWIVEAHLVVGCTAGQVGGSTG
jgi:hypothetical protein